MYTKSNLDNGIRVIKAPLEESQTATIMVMFGTGSRYEHGEIMGMSHFLEHMFFKGTEKRPSSVDITRELDGVGAEFNAFTSKDHTAYYVKVAHEHLPLAIDVVSDMLLNSKFDETELNKEKGVIVEEKNMYEDNPLMYIDDILEDEMFKDSTLGQLIIGTTETIKGTTRENMVHYKQTHYHGGNTAVCVSGKLPSDVDSLIEEAFSPLPSQAEADGESEFKPFEVNQSEPRVRIMHRESEQAQMALAFPSYSYTHKDSMAARLLAVILGGNMSSRLFVSIREERGLAYMVRASQSHYQDVGSFMIQAGLDKSRIEPAIEVIREELMKLMTEGVAEDELQRAKDYLQGKISIGLEDTSSLAQWYSRQEVLTGETKTPDEVFTEVKSVTAEDIKRVANDLFKSERSTLALIGPYKDEEPFKSLLK